MKTTVQPNATHSNDDWDIIGAASVHSAISDDSASSHIERNSGVGMMAKTRIGFALPSLPSGAILKRGTARVRSRNAGGGDYSPMLRIEVDYYASSGEYGDSRRTQQVQWGSGNWHSMGLGGLDPEKTLTGINAWIRRLKSTYSHHVLVISEMEIEITYVEKPELTVDEPSGTLTDNNRPTVEWTPDLDPDGGAQQGWRVKIFDDATYTAGGFDPGSSTPVHDSGNTQQVAASGTTKWQVPGGLEDDTYRAYVWTTQKVNGLIHYSDPVSSEFTIDVATPAVPTLTLSDDPDNGRIQIDLAENAATADTDEWQVEYSESGDDGTWEELRTELGDGTVANPTPGSTGEETVYDYEAPNGTTRFYRARAVSDHGEGLVVASDWCTAESDTWTAAGDYWIKHPFRPDLNMEVQVYSLAEQHRDSGATVHKVLSRSDPIVTKDSKRIMESGDLVLQFHDGRSDDLDELLNTGDPLLLQFPSDADEPDRWIAILDHRRIRVIDNAGFPRRRENIKWQQVVRPTGDLHVDSAEED